VIKNHNLSLLSKNWQPAFLDSREVLTLQQKCQVSEVLASLLYLRGINHQQVFNFLNPKIKNALPDPKDLQNIDIACQNIYEALLNKKKITIFADYDVDGATSSAILVLFFRSLNFEVDVYIPDRILEGYGPNINALLNLKNNGTDLVIMVDCGTVAFAPLLAAKEAGLDIIVIDHHLGALEKPQAIAVINPNSVGETFSHKNLCAAGVVFLCLVALNKTLRDNNFFSQHAIVEPNLLNLLDLVALGTVCDVMPLVDLNRAFVKHGLQVLAKRQNLGLKTICDVVKLNNKPNVYSLGFVIGPRINAGGRVGNANLGSKLLTCQNEYEAQKIATLLNDFNEQRKTLEDKILQEAIQQLENKTKGFSHLDNIIFAVGDNWHQGIIGIIASRLKDLYNKPVAVITIIDQNKAKASCRSVASVDFGRAILEAKVHNLLLEGGGHAMAGGFSVEPNKIKDLQQFFNKNLEKSLQNSLNKKVYQYDFALDWSMVNIDLLQEINKLEPFGLGNPQPIFLLHNIYKINAKKIGKKQDHIICYIASKTPFGFNNQANATAFRSTENALGSFLLNQKNKTFSAIGCIDINYWFDVPKIQLVINDIYH
jgi:single-stranded-DNA-specific exonuclease